MEFLTLTEIVEQARLNLARHDWDYLVGAAETETSMGRNRLALDQLALRSRVLNDVSGTQVRRQFLGHDLRIPVMLAPIGSVQSFDPSGGIGVAQAAADFGVMMTLSSACQPDYQEVAAVPANKVYQLYAIGDDDWLYRTAEHAQELGYQGFCLTGDTQVYSRRERDLLKRFVPASGRRVAVGELPPRLPDQQSQLTWKKIAELKRRLSVPLYVKGIATAEDSHIACEEGVDVVWVSNHGGRQLDHTLGTLDVLPEVVAAVDGRARIIVDGGILRGTDVLKALALGADIVAVGRLLAWAMAAGGPTVVVRALEILEHEIVTNLALMGQSDIDALNPSLVRSAAAVGRPSVTSALPLLGEY